MFSAVFTNVTLCVPAASEIERCGVVRPVSLPSIQMLHGGLLDTISLPLPPSDFVAFGASGFGSSMLSEAAGAATFFGAARCGVSACCAAAVFTAGAAF